MLKLFKFFNAETKVNKCLFSPHMCQALRPEQGGGLFSCALFGFPKTKRTRE